MLLNISQGHLSCSCCHRRDAKYSTLAVSIREEFETCPYRSPYFELNKTPAWLSNLKSQSPKYFIGCVGQNSGKTSLSYKKVSVKSHCIIGYYFICQFKDKSLFWSLKKKSLFPVVQHLASITKRSQKLAVSPRRFSK